MKFTAIGGYAITTHPSDHDNRKLHIARCHHRFLYNTISLENPCGDLRG